MKRISDVINELEQLQKKHGDLPVLVYDDWNEVNIGLIRYVPRAWPVPVSPIDENEFEMEEENRHSEAIIIYSRAQPEYSSGSGQEKA